MKNLSKIAFILSFMITIISCNQFLDVVPDDTPTLDHAFANRAMSERYLFTCYKHLPDPTNPYHYPAHLNTNDEFYLIGGESNQHTQSAPSTEIRRGNQNSNSPLMDYWSGKNGGRSMFNAIRDCNIFLENINIPKDIDETERSRWIAEVKFLKAYYHFFLLQLYGPIPLIKENFELYDSPEAIKVYREPFDECIDYIVELIDESLPDLPLTITNNIQEDGRITRPIALAVKAKALTLAASPLFNGNSDYSGWVDKRGVQLISNSYDNEKWKIALDAIEEAIDVAHSAGHQLYKYNKDADGQFNMNESISILMNTRKGITEKWNSGVIWSSMETFGNKNNIIPTYPAMANFQWILFPIMYSQDVGKGPTSYCYASFDMAELFYTRNGLPINEDPSWDYSSRYNIRYSTTGDNNEHYIPVGEATAALNFDREPRFYASLGFDRGYFELSTTSNNFGSSFSRYLTLRAGEAGNLSNETGYSVKKLIAFETSLSRGSSSNNYQGYDYRFPLIRLADLYLLHSEAANEYYDSPNDKVYVYIDKVRENVGLPGVVNSWSRSLNPNRPFDKVEMRKIIQQERMIELAFEGQRFWDIRRWKLGDEYWTRAPRGWNQKGRTLDEYYQVINLGKPRSFSPVEYLWPISIYDLRINNNLEQTFGW